MTAGDMCQSADVLERLVFNVKKPLRDGKEFRIVHTGGPKLNKWTITTAIGGIRKHPYRRLPPSIIVRNTTQEM